MKEEEEEEEELYFSRSFWLSFRSGHDSPVGFPSALGYLEAEWTISSSKQEYSDMVDQ
jgi:hypothetical protein